MPGVSKIVYKNLLVKIMLNTRMLTLQKVLTDIKTFSIDGNNFGIIS